jgi:hypothetical protein
MLVDMRFATHEEGAYGELKGMSSNALRIGSVLSVYGSCKDECDDIRRASDSSKYTPHTDSTPEVCCDSKGWEYMSSHGMGSTPVHLGVGE